MKLPATLIAITLLGAGAAPVFAESGAAPAAPVLRLSAETVRRVSVDEMTVTVASERTGEAPGALNSQVLAQLEAALAEARRTPGVVARLGNLQTQPAPRGRPGPWQVRGEVILEARDFRALGELAGRLAQRLQISSVRFGLSGDRRRAVEQELLAEAAAAFQDKAGAAARAFGFRNYRIGEITLGTAGPRPGPLVMRMAASAEAAIGVPTEGGEAEVQVRVEGTVLLLAAP